MSNSYDIILNKIIKNGLELEFISFEYQNDFFIVKEAVKQNGLALKFASCELRDDFEIVFEAVRNDSFAFEFASLRLRNNINIIKRALSINDYEVDINNWNNFFKALKIDISFLDKISIDLKNNIDFFRDFRLFLQPN